MDSTGPPIPSFDHITDPQARAIIEQLCSMVAILQPRILELEAENAELKRMLFGHKSERMCTVDEELKKKRKNSRADKARRRQAAKEKRRENAEAKKKLPEEEVVHQVPEQDQVCPHCGGTKFDDLGEGEVSYEYEWVPGHFVRRKHVRKKKACRCGQYIVTAPAPARVIDGGEYGPGFYAHVVVSKCCDSIPLYRQEKQLKRLGIRVNRSTMCVLFHRTADLVKPIWERLLELAPHSEYVNGDETVVWVLEPIRTRRAYMWVFVVPDAVVYYFSPSRSGETPRKVLGDSTGTLQVDAYSGYNQVTTPERRTRAGCWSHVRRRFYAALETARDEAKYALDRILDLYEVEYDAAEQNVLGSDRHLAMRRARSDGTVQKFHKWLKEQEPLHPPKSPMGKAVGYALNNSKALIVFLSDAKVRLDNNISEQQLRIIALGRKNYLFLGHDLSGEHLAILQSLISTCELNGVNPQEYLTDVLIRIQTHPMSRIDELLPQNWQPPNPPAGDRPDNDRARASQQRDNDPGEVTVASN